jgi:hypothetical protein
MELKGGKMKTNRVSYTTITLTDKEISQLILENKDANEGGKPVTAQLLNSLASTDEEAS